MKMILIFYLIVFNLINGQIEVNGSKKLNTDKLSDKNIPVKANEIISIDNEWHAYDKNEMTLKSGKLTKTLRVYGDLRGDNITLRISRNVQIYIYGNFFVNLGIFIFPNPRLGKYFRDSKDFSGESFEYYINVIGKFEFNNSLISIEDPKLKNIIPKQFYFVGLPKQNYTNITRSKLSSYPKLQFENLTIDNLILNNITILSDQFFSVISIKIRNYCVPDFCHLEPRNVISYSYILAQLKRKNYPGNNHVSSIIISGIFATFIAVFSIFCYINFLFPILS